MLESGYKAMQEINHSLSLIYYHPIACRNNIRGAFQVHDPHALKFLASPFNPASTKAFPAASWQARRFCLSALKQDTFSGSFPSKNLRISPTAPQSLKILWTSEKRLYIPYHPVIAKISLFLKILSIPIMILYPIDHDAEPSIYCMEKFSFPFHWNFMRKHSLEEGTSFHIKPVVSAHESDCAFFSITRGQAGIWCPLPQLTRLMQLP